MDKEPTLDELRERAEKWACCIEEISAVFLFGSRARNEPNPNDWDICVLVDGYHNNSWYGIWTNQADTWKKEFCRVTGLPEGRKTQFCTVTDPKVHHGLFESTKVLYVRNKKLSTVKPANPKTTP